MDSKKRQKILHRCTTVANVSKSAVSKVLAHLQQNELLSDDLSSASTSAWTLSRAARAAMETKGPYGDLLDTINLQLHSGAVYEWVSISSSTPLK